MTVGEGPKIAGKATTRVSTKGQVILPKAIRDEKNWQPGTALTVEVTEEGVLLRDTPVFPRTKHENVRGMLKYEGPPRTIEDMNEGIAREVRQRHARGRY